MECFTSKTICEGQDGLLDIIPGVPNPLEELTVV